MALQKLVITLREEVNPAQAGSISLSYQSHILEYAIHAYRFDILILTKTNQCASLKNMAIAMKKLKTKNTAYFTSQTKVEKQGSFIGNS